MSSLVATAGSSKPPMGLAFVRRAAMERVSFDTEAGNSSESANARSGKYNVVSRSDGPPSGASDGVAESAEEGPAPMEHGPVECGDGSLVWPPDTAFELADACVRGEASTLMQKLMSAVNPRGSSGHVDPDADIETTGATGRKRLRGYGRSGPNPTGEVTAMLEPETSMGYSGDGNGSHGGKPNEGLSLGVGALIRDAAKSARGVVGRVPRDRYGAAGEQRTDGSNAGHGITVDVGASGTNDDDDDDGDEEAAFRQLCKLRTAARTEAQLLLKRARTGRT